MGFGVTRLCAVCRAKPLFIEPMDVGATDKKKVFGRPPGGKLGWTPYSEGENLGVQHRGDGALPAPETPALLGLQSPMGDAAAAVISQVAARVHAA